MVQFRVLPEAEKDLESIWHYIVQNWELDQVESYLDGLVDILNSSLKAL